MRYAAKAREIGTLLALVSLAAVACGGGSDGDFNADDTEVVVHTAAGGGSDIFAREVVNIAQEEGVIDTNWPVRNETEGDGIGAMSHLLSRRGDDNTIAAMTPTWLVTPITVEGDTVTVDQLQPICRLVSEPAVLAVRDDSPFQDLTDVLDAARQQPNELVQTGGSITASDSLVGRALQNSAGVQWRFVSFEDTGSRIAALLRGDADIMIGTGGDFTEQVRAGDLKVITSLGAQRVELFPDAPSMSDLGLDSAGLPQQFRGLIAPPEISREALEFYENACEQLIETDRWATYVADNGLITDFANSDDFTGFLTDQQESLSELIDQLDLRN